MPTSRPAARLGDCASGPEPTLVELAPEIAAPNRAGHSTCTRLIADRPRVRMEAWQRKGQRHRPTERGLS